MKHEILTKGMGFVVQRFCETDEIEQISIKILLSLVLLVLTFLFSSRNFVLNLITMICGNYVSDTHDVITVHPHEKDPNTYVVEYGKESIEFLQAEKQEKIQEFIMERLENDIVMFHFEGKKLEVLDKGIEKRYKLEK